MHTKYSLLDAIIKPEELIQTIKNQGKTAICITEHGNLYSSIEAYKLCQENGIKYLHGCEMYICEDINITDSHKKYNHLILISKNETGRLNLIKLVSESKHYKYYGKPRIDFNMLKQYSDGLVCCSACMAGEVDGYLMSGNINKAKEIISKYKGLFKEDYYLELQSHSDLMQQKLNRQLVDLSKELDVPYIITTDAHYLKKDEQKYHSIFVQIGQAREVGETYDDCYIQTEDEIYTICCQSLTKEEIEVGIKNTTLISEKCNVNIPLSAPIMPVEDVPKEFKSQIQYLRYLCVQGWKERKINLKPKQDIQKYKDRLVYELNAIEKMGFEGYYLFVWGYANSVTRRGIARGSGGGSLVAYLTHIVDIDPIKYGLYFERFIDVSALPLLEQGKITKSQLKIPDFDLDFGKADREKVVDFVVKRYGRNRVACLGSFQYIWAKGAIKDIGKVLGIPFDITNQMTKSLDKETIDEVLDLGLLKDYEKQYPKLFDYAKHLAGLPKSFSAHPCAKCACPQETTYYTSVDINDNGDYILEGDMHTAEDLGLIKADFLGLRTVDIIYDCLEMISKDYQYIAPHNLNFEDPDVWDCFKNGMTEGIFQFESAGMKDTLKDMQCSCLEDLTVANALYRPGAMKFISNYNNRKKGIEKFEYLHPDLEHILGNSYGIIVFQEQLIEIGRLAGLQNPDELRKATAKKKPKLMAKIEPEMKKGLMNRGWSQVQVDTLWDMIIDFASYSFNKSHAAAYAIIAYICMFLKVHHTKEFMCAWINSYIGKNEHLSPCVNEAKRMGLKVYMPKVKSAFPLTCLYKDGIILGTASIKFCNKQTGKIISDIIKSNNNISFNNLMKSLNINSRQMNTLIGINFFDIYGKNQYLSDIYKIYLIFNGKVQIKKSSIPKYTEECGVSESDIKQCCNDETNAYYRQFDCDKLINLKLSQLENKSMGIKKQIEFEQEHLEYINFTDNRAPSTLYYVVEMKFYKDKSKPYLILYGIKNGYTIKTKVSKPNNFIENPFKEGNIINITKFPDKYKSKMVNGKWQKTNEKEKVVEEWVVY